MLRTLAFVDEVARFCSAFPPPVFVLIEHVLHVQITAALVVVYVLKLHVGLCRFLSIRQTLTMWPLIQATNEITSTTLQGSQVSSLFLLKLNMS